MTVDEIVDAQMLRLRRIGLMHETEVRDAMVAIAHASKAATDPYVFADGRGPFIQTYPSGLKFHVYSPTLDEIRIEDIAHGLSTECRFGGQCPFFSVAQHSVNVSRCLAEFGDAEVRMIGLLHDSAEAYVGDVPRPYKYSPAFAAYRELEKRIQKCVYEKFNLDVTDEIRGWLRHVDDLMLATEKKELFGAQGHALQEYEVALPQPARMRLMSVMPAIAENIFLQEFAVLNAHRTST